MHLIFQTNCDNIDWERVPQMLQEVGMSFVDAKTHRISFENSYSVVFVFDEGKMIGFGRTISDGVRQSAFYDIVVDPTYQGGGIGRRIVEKLMEHTPHCNFILYASPGKEDFYKKFKFKKMKTAMGLFVDPKRMENEDFFEI